MLGLIFQTRDHCQLEKVALFADNIHCQMCEEAHRAQPTSIHQTEHLHLSVSHSSDVRPDWWESTITPLISHGNLLVEFYLFIYLKLEQG